MIQNEYFSVKSNGVTPSGIAYQRPTSPTQLTSYRTGDAGDCFTGGTYSYAIPTYPTHNAKLDYTAATPLITLIDNNYFGTKDRYTDINGLQVYSDDYVIDHYTGLGWYRRWGTTSFRTNWNDAIDESLASTAGGFTDWRLPSISEYESLLNFESNYALYYPPFQTSFIGAGNYFWTNQTDFITTTSAIALSFYLNASRVYELNLVAKTTATYYHLSVRNHFN